jgi:hypothetical protein
VIGNKEVKWNVKGMDTLALCQGEHAFMLLMQVLTHLRNVEDRMGLLVCAVRDDMAVK